jgi:glycosyltransferase involved in cell wall biosynthesis
MEIIVDARLILPQQTGIGRYLLGLAQGFNNISKSEEFEFWIQENLPPDHQVWSLQSSRLRLRELSIAHMSIHQQWAIPINVKRKAHDVFHYPHFDLPFATPGKTVVTIHDLKYLVNPDYFPQLARVKRLLMQVMMSYAVRRAQLVITVSNNTKNDIAQRLKIPSEKIRVTHHGVDKRYYTKTDPLIIDAYRQRFSLQDPFIFFVGERRPHKNITGVIQAFKTFITMTPMPYRLVVAGKPYAGYHAPEHLVENLGLADRILFIDTPPDEDVRILFQSAEALLLLSRYEGFGLPLLEAMASGTPVIASNATSLPEVIGDAGIVVPIDDPATTAEALRQIVAGGEKRELMIARGYERARQFTWERCAQQTIDIYREINNS